MGKSLVIATTCMALSVFGVAGASATTTMTTAEVGTGQFVVDQTTGAISFCIPLTGGTALAPTPVGKCAQIGTATVSTNPSLQVIGPFSTGISGVDTSFVTNVYTGKVTQCEYYYNSNLGTIYGDCAVIGTAPLGKP